MSAIDVNRLLEPISPDDPCGPDLEYDPAFGELTRQAEGRPEQQIGDSVVAAVEPDWREVRRLGVELLARSKDLRAGVLVTRALMHAEGLVGLSDGLALLRGLVERYWEPVHPRLDPDDGNDPTLRVNTLASLADWDQMVRPLRDVPLTNSRALGRFALRHIEIADGTLSRPEGDQTPDLPAIEAAFMDTEVTDLQARDGALKQSLEHVQAIEVALTERVGAANSADLGPLRAALRKTGQVLTEQLARRGVGEGDGAAAGAGAGPRPMTGEITSREDVIRLLDRACDYFNRHEPSSPVPLLLQRAKRLVSKSFIEIVRDLTPSGVSEAEGVGGLDRERE